MVLSINYKQKVKSMKKLISIAVSFSTAFIIIVSFFSCSAQAPKANLKTDIDSLSYAYGISMGLDEYLQSIGIEGTAKDEFIKGFLEGSKANKDDQKAKARLEGKMIGRQAAVDMFPRIDRNVFGSDSTHSLNKTQFLAGLLASIQNKKLLINKEEAGTFVQTKSDEIHKKPNEKFLEDNKTKEGVVTLPSGLQYKAVNEGSGPKPTAEDTVTVNYTGKDISGNVFDSNEKATFPLNRVIAGWTEGIQLMSVGSTYTFYIPYNLGYGERGSQPNIGPYATHIFDVELLEISAKK